MLNSPHSVDTLGSLKDLVESKTGLTAVQTLQQRTWILHWALLVHPTNMEAFLDLFSIPVYSNALLTASTHLLRYFVFACIMTQRKLPECVRVVEAALYQYRDSITNFMHCLYTDCDFTRMSAVLTDMERVSRCRRLM